MYTISIIRLLEDGLDDRGYPRYGGQATNDSKRTSNDGFRGGDNEAIDGNDYNSKERQSRVGSSRPRSSFQRADSARPKERGGGDDDDDDSDGKRRRRAMDDKDSRNMKLEVKKSYPVQLMVLQKQGKRKEGESDDELEDNDESSEKIRRQKIRQSSAKRKSNDGDKNKVYPEIYETKLISHI